MSTKRQAASPRSHAPSLRPSGAVTEADGASAPATSSTTRTSPTCAYGHRCRILVGLAAAVMLLLSPDVVVPRVPVAAAFRPSLRMAPHSWRCGHLVAGSTRASNPPLSARRGQDAAGDDEDVSRGGWPRAQQPPSPPPLPLRPPTPGKSMLFDPDRESECGSEPRTGGITDTWMHWEEDDDDDESASLALYWEQTKGAYNAVFVRLPVLLAGAFYAKNYLAEGRPLVMDLGFGADRSRYTPWSS